MSTAISVVIRTFNSAATLSQVLAQLNPQADDEVIVVDSGSTDSTLKVAEEYGARVLKAPQPFNYSRSLNIGFRAAKNPWVLSLSSHCIPLQGQYLTGWKASLATIPERVAVAYGPCVQMEGETLRGNRGKFCCLDREAWEKTKDMFGGNSNGIYRRELWQRHEFDESLATAEDLEWMFWAFANGYMLANIPERKVLYRNSGPLRHMFRKGYHEAKLARQMLRTEKMPLQHLGIALGSLIKRLLLGRIGPGFFLRQCAHRWGAFLGSRAAHISTKPQ